MVLSLQGIRFMRGLGDIDFQGIGTDGDSLFDFFGSALNKLNPINVYQPKSDSPLVDTTTPSIFKSKSALNIKPTGMMSNPFMERISAFNDMLNPPSPIEFSPASQKQSAIDNFLTKIDEFISPPSKPVSSSQPQPTVNQVSATPPQPQIQQKGGTPQGQQKGPPNRRLSPSGLCDGNNLYICLAVGAVVVGGLIWAASRN